MTSIDQGKLRMVSGLQAGDVVRRDPGGEPVTLTRVTPARGSDGTTYEYQEYGSGPVITGCWAGSQVMWELLAGPSLRGAL